MQTSAPPLSRGSGAGDRLRLAYLAGTSYCGSTLLSFVLDGHPQILSIGEVSATHETEGDDYPCSCGKPIGACPFFSAIRAAMRERYGVQMDPSRWDLRPVLYANPRLDRFMQGHLEARGLSQMRRIAQRLHRPFEQQMQLYAMRNEAFIRTSLELSGKQVFFDASKQTTRIPLLERIAKEELLILHLVRDPRGYAYSSQRHDKLSALESAAVWRKVNSAIDSILARLPRHRWMRMRYEDLCLEPARNLRRLTEFMGVPAFVDAPLEYRGGSHHVIGNQMRLSSDPRSSLKLDEKWRSALTFGESRDVWRASARLAEAYGYES